MFWDSSAIVPLLVPEATSRRVTAVLGPGARMAVWWASPLECLSALHRRHREGLLPAESLQVALTRLRGLVEDADVVAPTDAVLDRAARLVGAHPLRAGDALQLAAALLWCDEHPRGHSFVCLDDRLRGAAQREGFALLPG
jgi:uncharacterized protein